MNLSVGGGIAILYRKGLDLQIRLMFLDPEGKLVVLDMKSSNVEGLQTSGYLHTEKFRTAEILQAFGGFPGYIPFLVLLEDFNAIVDVKLNHAGLSETCADTRFPEWTNADTCKLHLNIQIISR